MDISGISNSQFRDFAVTQNRQEAEVNRFRDLLATAMEGQVGPNHEGTVLDRAEIRNAAEMFESFFINMMFREMRRTSAHLNENSFLPKSHAEKIFTEMMDEQVAENAARAGGIGIADMIYKQMTRHLN
jgi:flagellar protein FlgJ